MELRWIGTRTPHSGTFQPSGLGTRPDPSAAPRALLTAGSILIEAHLRPTPHPITLLHYSAVEPWPVGLNISISPDGTVRLSLRQGDRQIETVLQTTLGRTEHVAQVTYVWDGPARRGAIAVYLPDAGLLWQTEVLAPFPLSYQDVKRLTTAGRHMRLDPSVAFVAVAEGLCPVGPMPGLSGKAAIETPDGLRLLSDLRAGDLVSGLDKTKATVVWAGSVTLPALGRFAPMRMRSPYLKLWDDLVVARDQRVCLSGSEVEYLFGEERVSTPVRHLEHRNSVAPVKSAGPLVTYHQLLLDSQGILVANGTAVESLDAAPVLARRDMQARSVLADAPVICPNSVSELPTPVLQGYEALTLTGVMVG